MSWQAILKSPIRQHSSDGQDLDAYVVKESIWKEAFGTLGSNDADISTGRFEATFKEIEKALNRKLTPHDFAFYSMNFMGDVERHLGTSKYKLMLQLFTDRDYQIESLEGFATDSTLYRSRKGLQKELENK